MRKIVKLLIIVVTITAFSLYAQANETDEYLEKFEEILPDGYKGLSESTEELVSLVSLESLLGEIFSALSGRRGEILSFFLLLLGCATLLSVAGLSKGKLSRVCCAGVGMICSVLIFERLCGLFVEMSEALDEINKFFSALIPVMSAVTVAGGGSSTAAVSAVGMNITLSIVGGIGGTVFTSVVGFGFAMGLLCAFGNEGISSVVRGVRNFFMWLLGIGTALIMGTLSLQTVVASAADSAAMRAAKYMASGMIPVVGGTVSGALSTLFSGLSYVKSVIGVGAVWVIISVLTAPLFVLLLYRFALSLAVSFSEFVGSTSVKEPFSTFRFSLDSLIAVYSLSMILYIFEIILFVKSGVSML